MSRFNCLHRLFLCDGRGQSAARVLSISVHACKPPSDSKIRDIHTQKVPLNTTYGGARVLNRKYGKHDIKLIKVPRFLRQSKDKEKIARYYLVKRLCLENSFEEAISNLQNWLQFEPVTTSNVLILNGLLYSLFEQGRMEDIVNLKEMMDSHSIKGDRSTYAVLIDSFGKMENFDIVSKLLAEVCLLNIVPHHRSYLVAAELALREKYFAKAVQYFLKIESISKETNDGFCALFITRLVEEQQVNGVESILKDFRDNRTRIGQKTMFAIDKYFHSGLLKDKWKTNRTLVSTSGICDCCEEKLKETKFGKPEEYLSEYFNNINGQLISHASRQESHLQEFLRFLNEEGPFKVVVDGLNMAMHPLNGLNFASLFKVVEHYSSQGYRVLVIAANELIRPKSGSKAISTAEHEKAMAYLKSISTVYYVKHNKSGIDDLFLINAALHLCRKDNDIKLVSNDKFMDHRAKMKPQTLSYFKRWLSDHQLMVHWYERTRMKLFRAESKTVYTRMVHKTDNTWHFPSVDEKTWMCAQKELRNHDRGL